MDNKNIDYHKLNPSEQKGYISKNGYRVIQDRDYKKRNRNKSDTYEQRWVWEHYHNCCLTKWAEVHHLNGDKLDNRIDNLQAVMRSEHKRLHWLGNQLQKKDMTGRFCQICGSTETYIKKDGWPQWFDLPDGGHMCRKCHDKERWLKKKNKK
jgi:HNH endonuclease